MSYFADVVSVTEIFIRNIIGAISAIFTVLGTPLGELLDRWASVPGLGSFQLLGDVLNWAVDVLLLGDVTLFGFMFGSSIVILFAFTIVKWAIDILP